MSSAEADRPTNSDEIEITPEMIEAGLAKIYSVDLACFHEEELGPVDKVLQPELCGGKR